MGKRLKLIRTKFACNGRDLFYSRKKSGFLVPSVGGASLDLVRDKVERDKVRFNKLDQFEDGKRVYVKGKEKYLMEVDWIDVDMLVPEGRSIYEQILTPKDSRSLFMYHFPELDDYEGDSEESDFIQEEFLEDALTILLNAKKGKLDITEERIREWFEVEYPSESFEEFYLNIERHMEAFSSEELL